MKQHITIQQLNELSDKGKEKLREWWKPALGNLFTTLKNDKEEFFDLYSGMIGDMENDLDSEDILLKRVHYDSGDAGYLIYPLLSISQMIEFLGENYNEISLGFNDSGVYWHVHVGPRGTGAMMQGFGKTYDSNEEEKELVDALWEAVKEKLNG